MNVFDPTKALSNIKDASDMAIELGEYWSKNSTTQNGLKKFITINKSFFEKTSLTMGVFSVGCSVADAMGLFTGSRNQIPNQLNEIDKKLDLLKASMDSQFNALSVKIDYVVANATLKAPRSNIMEEINKASLYKELVEEGNKLVNLEQSDDFKNYNTVRKMAHETAKIRNAFYKEAAKNSLLRSDHDLGVDIRQLYDAFIDPVESGNILTSTLNYFAGAPTPVINKGYELLYLALQAVQVIGLKERLLLEDKYRQMQEPGKPSEFNIKYCVEFIDYQYSKLYKTMIDDMEKALNTIVTNAVENTEASIPKCFESKVKAELKKGSWNALTVCQRMESYFPYMDFTVIEFGPFSENNKNASESGVRASSALTFYSLKETGLNLHIWWDWRPEIPENTNPKQEERLAAENEFYAKLKTKSDNICNTKVIPLEDMDQYYHYTEEVDGHKYYKKNLDIPSNIKQKFNTTLFQYSAAAHSIVIRRDESPTLNHACSTECWRRLIYKNSPGKYYYVFWMLLDVEKLVNS